MATAFNQRESSVHDLAEQKIFDQTHKLIELLGGAIVLQVHDIKKTAFHNFLSFAAKKLELFFIGLTLIEYAYQVFHALHLLFDIDVFK